MVKSLAHFTITPSADGYELRIEDDGGDTLELRATWDQLDLISEEINAQLNAAEEEATSVEDGSGDEADLQGGDE